MGAMCGWFFHSWGSGDGLMLEDPHGARILYALKFGFKESNNEVDYKALIASLKLTKNMGVERLQALLDSMLVIQQVKGEYEMKGENMAKYLEVI